MFLWPHFLSLFLLELKYIDCLILTTNLYWSILFYSIFLFLSPFGGSFYWPNFKLIDSIFICVKSTDDPVEGMLHLSGKCFSLFVFHTFFFLTEVFSVVYLLHNFGLKVDMLYRIQENKVNCVYKGKTACLLFW